MTKDRTCYFPLSLRLFNAMLEGSRRKAPPGDRLAIRYLCPDNALGELG
jgi:hypothetical protein